MCRAQGSQRSDTGQARTRGPSVSSQALYHWATALPRKGWYSAIMQGEPFHRCDVYIE